MKKNDPNWMEKAFSKHPGALHKELGVKMGKTIPVHELVEAARKPGKEGERARAALNARGVTHPHSHMS